MDRDGVKTLLEAARDGFTRLSHVWLDAAYNGQEKGADWVEKVLGWSTGFGSNGNYYYDSTGLSATIIPTS
jgi:hypothetical protein